jgi:hypothetical protein
MNRRRDQYARADRRETSPLRSLISKDRDGEVVAAARALIRTLQANGLDIHAFADTIGNANGARVDGDRRGARNRSEPSWHTIACECAERPEILHSDREPEFVKRMVRATVRGGKLSEKQEDWLRKIYARVMP